MGEKVYSSQRGFPTPDTIPDVNGYRIFHFPDDNEWVGLLMAAVLPLTDPYAYYDWGAISPNDTADLWEQIIEAAPFELIEATADVEAPFWDDESDADTTSPPDDQPWYEDLIDVVVTGFLATIISPAGAIEFVTTARKIRVAFRRHDAGGLFDLFVDGDAVTRVDTYAPSPDISYVDVLVP